MLSPLHQRTHQYLLRYTRQNDGFHGALHHLRIYHAGLLARCRLLVSPKGETLYDEEDIRFLPLGSDVSTQTQLTSTCTHPIFTIHECVHFKSIPSNSILRL